MHMHINTHTYTRISILLKGYLTLLNSFQNDDFLCHHLDAHYIFKYSLIVGLSSFSSYYCIIIYDVPMNKIKYNFL